MNRIWETVRRPFVLLALAVATTSGNVAAKPMLESNIDRPLRYTPEGTDFVIVNSPEYFNRPLYTNTAFRVDGGDQPEFALYLPGRGGNLKIGFYTATGGKWLSEASRVEARYRPGSLVYEISDPLLGDAGKLNLTAMVLSEGQGLIVRVDTVNAPPVTLVWAYGGAGGADSGADAFRPSRDGDIGTGTPVGTLFQLSPANCQGDNFRVQGSTFTMQFSAGTGRTTASYVIHGASYPGATFATADANQWSSLLGLLATNGRPGGLPVLTGLTPLTSGQSAYLALQRVPQPGDSSIQELPVYVEAGGAAPASNLATASAPPVALIAGEDLPKIFDAAEARRESIAGKVSVDTPDPYINAATAALCVAADGIWDEPSGTYQHGAVAWRSRLLGWRGPYVADVLGWFDRANRDFTYWAGRQNTSPVVAPPLLDPKANYARDEPALHSNGDMSNSHYDMNLVAIDEALRHLLWTGDLDFARREWPVIQRHLAWEQRLFRRPFGGDDAPLYEGYAAIWASDDLEYDGGGVTHASAYNYYENMMAARVAALIGEDPAPYQREADLIRKAMRAELWLPSLGWYAENKDLLGLQRTHDSPAVWSFYTAVDEDAATPMEAWQMSRYIDTQIPHIPIRGPGVPVGYSTISTTDWMPYTWSLNNVAMAETADTSLAYWESNRADEAFKLFKGCLLDSMFLGLCPGNAGMCTYYDANRGESQRDFADGIGTTARALVEGLFGVHPDALAGELVIRPGFPADWDHASLHHPALDYSFRTEGAVKIARTTENSDDTGSDHAVVITRKETVLTPGYAEDYSVTERFAKPLLLRLQIVARRSQIAQLTVNGQPAEFRPVDDAVETPRIEIICPPAEHYDIRIVWTGAAPITPKVPAVVALGGELRASLSPAELHAFNDPQGALNNYAATPSLLTANAVGALGHRTVFLKVQQGQLAWWAPLSFEIRPAFEIIPSAAQDDAHVRFTVRNNTATAINQDATVTLAGHTDKIHLAIPAYGESSELALDGRDLLPGSAPVSLDLGKGQTASAEVTCWKRVADPAKFHFETVNMATVFNDQVGQIFKNQYLSPRSPYPSLAIPLQGYGNWTNTTATFNVNDSGLRAASLQGNGVYTLPQQDVPFATPGNEGAKNIVYTSQWDNYPHAVDVPLAGKASHVYLLMAGSTNAMQSRIDNGEVVVTYADGSAARLALENPATWWPIDTDYFIDDFAFRRTAPIPPRVDLATGQERTLDLSETKGGGGRSRGGAATVLDLPLNPAKELKTLTVRTLANDVVIGLMAATLVR
jgi:hypothetical protein